jgi:hypothetical protein
MVLRNLSCKVMTASMISHEGENTPYEKRVSEKPKTRTRKINGRGDDVGNKWELGDEMEETSSAKTIGRKSTLA